MSVLESQEVLVIGGSSGIGLAAARAAAARGAFVTIASRSQIRLRAALQALPHGTKTVSLDLGLAKWAGTHSKIDHLIDDLKPRCRSLNGGCFVTNARRLS
jgi:NAD(P)-dependent dehydrogenase (short-subunit alcohol dehydrogenase family)